MNTDRSSDGPYSVSDAGCLVFRNGRGVVNFDSRRDAINAASLANRSHAEGRKAAEKEQAEQKWLGHTAQDFRELLEFTNCVAQMMKEIWAVYVPSHDPSFLVKFTAWKKARGIE